MLNNDQYSEFYDCLSRMFVQPYVRKNEALIDSQDASPRVSIFTYSMRVLWRLLTELPPPISYLKRFIDRTIDSNQKPFELNTIVIILRFMSRFSDSTFTTWMEDGLCKQKMNQKEAVQLIDNFKDRICSLEFGLNFFESVFKSCAESKTSPSVTEMIIADLLLNRFLALLLDKSTEIKEKYEAKLNVILPLLSCIAQMYLAFTKSSLIEEACHGSSDQLPDTPESKTLINLLMSIAAPSIGGDLSYDFGVSSWLYAHSSIRRLALDWLKDDDTIRGYPSYKIASGSDTFAIPDGSFSQLFATHLRIISEADPCLIPVVQRLLYANITAILFIIK
uniref:E3 ubiquitin-protein ligase UBR4 N-terminal domain-containing protein n=1 Tax=Romanomermis culicivorax TaxID=13658 RepID=A0A915JEI7_ROMCU